MELSFLKFKTMENILHIKSQFTNPSLDWDLIFFLIFSFQQFVETSTNDDENAASLDVPVRDVFAK